MGLDGVILTLVPSLRPPELQKHHFTLTGKPKEDIPTTKADPPQNPTLNGSQTPGRAVEESHLVHGANLLGCLVAKAATETQLHSGDM